MTIPGAHQFGGGQNPYDPAAQATIAAARARMSPPRPPVLSPEDRAEAEKRPEDDICRLCIGIHKFPNGPGCPRVATFKLNGDGVLVEGTFWEGKAWAEGRVVLWEDVHEGGEEAGDGSE